MAAGVYFYTLHPHPQVIDAAGAWRPCDDPALTAEDHARTAESKSAAIEGDGWAMSGTDALGTRIEY